MTPEEHQELKSDLWKQYRLQGVDAAVQSSPDQHLGDLLSEKLHSSVGKTLQYGGLGALGGAALGGGLGALTHVVRNGTWRGATPSIRDSAIVGTLGGAVSGLNFLQHRQLRKALDEWKSSKEKTAATRWKQELSPEFRELYEKARGLRNLRNTGGAIDEGKLIEWTHQFPPRFRKLVADKVLDSAPGQYGPQTRFMAEARKTPTGFGMFEKNLRNRTPSAGRAASGVAGPATGAFKDFMARNKWPLIGLGGAAGLGGLALLASRLAKRDQYKKLRGEYA
jgi:hypothetical protein